MFIPLFLCGALVAALVKELVLADPPEDVPTGSSDSEPDSEPDSSPAGLPDLAGKPGPTTHDDVDLSEEERQAWYGLTGDDTVWTHQPAAAEPDPLSSRSACCVHLREVLSRMSRRASVGADRLWRWMATNSAELLSYLDTRLPGQLASGWWQCLRFLIAFAPSASPNPAR